LAHRGVRTILVESPDRFARDLAVQLAGHDFLKSIDVTLIPATAPDFFVEDTPTAVLVRQVLGAIAQFEKASLVARLKAARASRRRPVSAKAASHGQRSISGWYAKPSGCAGDHQRGINARCVMLLLSLPSLASSISEARNSPHRRFSFYARRTLERSGLCLALKRTHC
jgi:resolvase-like protein